MSEAVETQRDLIQAQKIQFVAMMDLNTSTKGLNGGFSSLQTLLKALAKSTEMVTFTMVEMLRGFRVGLAAFNGAVNVGLSPINALGSVFTTLGGTIQVIDDKFGGFQKTIDGLIKSSPSGSGTKKNVTEWEGIKGFFGKLGSDLGTTFKGIGNILGGGTKALFGMSTPGAGLSSEGLKQTGGGLGGLLKGTFGSIGGQTKAALNPLSAAFGKMFPQMAALALVMEPVMAFIGGLLEPFSMITDMFGAFGEILGTALVPVLINSVMPLLQAFLPIFVSLSQVLAPVIQLLFSFSGIGILIQILTPLMPIIQLFATLLGQIFTAITPLLNLFSMLLGLGIDILLTSLINLFSGLGGSLSGFTDWITRLSDAIQNFVDKIFGWINNLKTQSPEDWKLTSWLKGEGWN